MAESLPSRLGRYEIRGKIADGGMASIYVGRLAGPGGFERLHALKVIKPAYSEDQDFVNMFLDEARIVAKLNHPNVVQIHELGEEGKQLFIAMELLLGESLWDSWHVARIRRDMAKAAGKTFPSRGSARASPRGFITPTSSKTRRACSSTWSTATSTRRTCSSPTTAR
jgi:serine/threonine protein kinase